MIIRVARFFDCSGGIVHSLVVSLDITHAVFLQLLAYKEPPCDGGEAQ